MTQTRSTCIALTLLFLAVSLAYGGYSVIRSAESGPEITTGSPNPAGSVKPAATTSGQQTSETAAPSSPRGSISSTEAEALDAQLQAIEDELDSLEVPGGSDDAAIEAGLE